MSINPSQISPQLINRYNAAAWTLEENGNTILLLREVLKAAKRNQPDKGNLVLLELNHQGGIVEERTVWRPQGANHLLEDPRALIRSDGSVMLGLTAVENNSTPFPAVTLLDSPSWRGDLNQIEVIKDFGPGKNTTPIDHETFFMRCNGLKNHHRLKAFKWNKSGATDLGEIDFPNTIDWASWRIGTTISPFWMNKNEALMIFHGIKIEKGKFVYSIGRAKLSKTQGFGANGLYRVEVDPKPILTPDDFLDEFNRPLIKELHPKLRRVVYACGGVLKKVNSQLVLALYVNVGDRQTVEVQIPWKELIANWWIN